jgi:hypothetical protein
MSNSLPFWPSPEYGDVCTGYVPVGFALNEHIV